MTKKQNFDNELASPNISLVLGHIAVKELEKLEDKVAVLARLGYGNAEIAVICNTTPASVRTLKSAAKKEKSSRRQK